jgi:predicted transcriptional regulator
MPDAADIVISVKPKYAARILSGEKSIELRRRRMRVAPGSRVWIYTKSPDAHISAYAVVEEIINLEPRELWRKHRNAVGVSLAEFNDYFVGVAVAWAMVLRDVRPLAPALRLSELRSRPCRFHPPQFFKRLQEGSPELSLLRARSKRPTTSAKFA